MVKKRQADLDVSTHFAKSRNPASTLATSNKVQKKNSHGQSLLEVISSGKKGLKRKVDQDSKSSRAAKIQVVPDDCIHTLFSPKSLTNKHINRKSSTSAVAVQPAPCHLFPPTPSYPNLSNTTQTRKAKTQTLFNKAVEVMPGPDNLLKSPIKEVARRSAEVSVSFCSDEIDSLVNNGTGSSHNKLLTAGTAKPLAVKNAGTAKSDKDFSIVQRGSQVKPKANYSTKIERLPAVSAEQSLRKKNKAPTVVKGKLPRKKLRLTRNSKPVSSVGRTIYLPTDTQPSPESVLSLPSNNQMPTPKQKFNEHNIQAVLKDLAGQTAVLGAIMPANVNQDMDTGGDGVQALWPVEENSWMVAFTRRVDVRGFASVTSLTKSGQVDVGGYKLSFGETADVYSPPGYHNGVIERLPLSADTDIPSMAEVRSILPLVTTKSFTELKEFCSLHEDCAIIHISELTDHRLQPCLDMLSFPKEVAGYISLSERLFVSDKPVAARYSSTTVAAADHLANHVDAGQPLRVLVCGDKNLGKSTLIRYIINRLLACGSPKVTHLECDPSQCEFSPPGCLTLHTVDQPLLGPPWTHLPSTVDHSQLYGALSADVAPDYYVSCVNKLLDEYEAGYTSTPLLVNTMGWKQGLGLHFLSATIARVKPTHVIQLSTDSVSYKNFEAFTVFRLSEHDLFIPQQSVRQLHETLNYELMPLMMSHFDTLESGYDLLSPIMSRDLTTTAYMFSSCLLHQRTINELTPYRVAMGDVAVELGSDKLPAHLVADGICMQVVVLCQAATNAVEKVGGNDFLQLTPSAPLDVIGYGVVRAVDKDSRCLYVSTPLSLSAMSQVNVLHKMQGTITPDSWFYLQLPMVKSDSNFPYFGFKKSGAGISATGAARYRYRKGR